MDEIVSHAMFGIILSLFAFEFGLFLQKKTKLLIMNPLLIAIIVIMAFLQVLHIPLKDYQIGGDIISLFLGPATVVLAVPLYQQLANLKRYLIPIFIGICSGIITSLISTIALCICFQLNKDMIVSLLPKSITTPIGIEVSSQLQGIPAITVLAILVTGIIGAVLADMTFKVFRISHPIAKGISLGTGAHAIGTTKAISLGKVEAAMSSLSIGVAGLLTVCIAPYVWQLCLGFIK